MVSMLGDLEPPQAMRDLKTALSDGDEAAMKAGLYEMLIAQALEFELQENGTLTPSTLDFGDLSVDEDSKKETMRYVYSCARERWRASAVRGGRSDVRRDPRWSGATPLSAPAPCACQMASRCISVA
eukprot:2674520-Prymnesium_polylepis.1